MTICKIIVWNNNLQKRCPERQFPKVWPKRPVTKKSCPGQQFINKKKYSAERHLHKKKLARTKVCRKRCPEHQFEKHCTERLFAKNKLSRTTVCRICKKMTCHNYLLKLCNIYQVDRCKIRIL